MCAVHVPIELRDLLNPPSPARPPGQPQPTDRVPPGQETPQPPEPLGLPPDQQRAEQVPLQAAQPPGQDPDAPGQLRPEALAPDPAQESDLGVGLVRQAFQALVAENAAMVDDSFNFVPEHGGSARRYSRGGSRGRSRATGRRRLARQTSLPYPTSETASPGSSPRYALRNRAQIQQPTRYSDGNTNTQASLNYRREGRHQRQSSESSTLSSVPDTESSDSASDYVPEQRTEDASTEDGHAERHTAEGSMGGPTGPPTAEGPTEPPTAEAHTDTGRTASRLRSQDASARPRVASRLRRTRNATEDRSNDQGGSPNPDVAVDEPHNEDNVRLTAEQLRGASISEIEHYLSSLGITQANDLWPVYRHICARGVPKLPMSGKWIKTVSFVLNRLGREQARSNSSVGQFLILCFPKLGIFPAIARGGGQNKTNAEREASRRHLAAYPGPQFLGLMSTVQKLGRSFYSRTAPPDTRTQPISDRDATHYGIAALRQRYPGPGCNPAADSSWDPEQGDLPPDGGSAAEECVNELCRSDIRAASRHWSSHVASRHPESADENTCLGVRPLTGETLRKLLEHTPGPVYSSNFYEMRGRTGTLPRPGQVSVPRELAEDIASHMRRQTALGLSGWSVDLMRIALGTNGFVEYMEKLTLRILNGNVPGMEFLNACRYLPLRKREGRTEPIAVPEVIYRVMIKAALLLKGRGGRNALLPTQFGVETPWGVAPVVRAAELAACYPESPLGKFQQVTVIKFKDAYSMIDRDVVASITHQHQKEIFAMVNAVYGTPSALVVNGKLRDPPSAPASQSEEVGVPSTRNSSQSGCVTDVDPANVQEELEAFDRQLRASPDPTHESPEATARRLANIMFGKPKRISTELSSYQGVRRGDPLANRLISLGLRQYMEKLIQDLGESHCVLSYLDTIVVLSRADPEVPRSNGAFALERAEQLCANRSDPDWVQYTPEGLVLDKDSSHVYTRADAMHGDGIPLLGTLVGTPEACARFAREKVRKVGIRIQALLDSPSLTAQNKWVLLRLSIQKACYHLLSLNIKQERVNSRGQVDSPWQDMDNQLLNALRTLRAAPHDSNLDWAFATLPERLGGAGLLSYVDRAAPWRGAAIAWAEHLLRCHGNLVPDTSEEALLDECSEVDMRPRPPSENVRTANQCSMGDQENPQNAYRRQYRTVLMTLSELCAEKDTARYLKLVSALPIIEGKCLMENTHPLMHRWCTTVPSNAKLELSAEDVHRGLQELVPSLNAVGGSEGEYTAVMPNPDQVGNGDVPSCTEAPTHSRSMLIQPAGGGFTCRRCGQSHTTCAHTDVCPYVGPQDHAAIHDKFVDIVGKHARDTGDEVEVEPFVRTTEGIRTRRRTDLRVTGHTNLNGGSMDYDFSKTSLTGLEADRRARSGHHGIPPSYWTNATARSPEASDASATSPYMTVDVMLPNDEEGRSPSSTEVQSMELVESPSLPPTAATEAVLASGPAYPAAFPDASPQQAAKLIRESIENHLIGRENWKRAKYSDVSNFEPFIFTARGGLAPGARRIWHHWQKEIPTMSALSQEASVALLRSRTALAARSAL